MIHYFVFLTLFTTCSSLRASVNNTNSVLLPICIVLVKKQFLLSAFRNAWQSVIYRFSGDCWIYITKSEIFTSPWASMFHCLGQGVSVSSYGIPRTIVGVSWSGELIVTITQ